MPKREPVAFISYVRDDDEHDAGRISDLRRRLEGEVKIQTGDPFPIFQDRNDIKWGQQWKERIIDTLMGVSFLIPVVTPSYFRSEMCRQEFETFLAREKTLGVSRLILPIYYVSCREIQEKSTDSDGMAEVLKARNWSDWRDFRFQSLDTPDLRARIADLATTIKNTMDELDSVFTASRDKAEAETRPPAVPVKGALPMSPVLPHSSANPLEIPIARGEKASKATIDRARKEQYYAYTEKFDEIITTKQLLLPAEVIPLHNELLKKIREGSKRANSQISVATDIISNTADKDDISIVILVDNSGSMRGKRIIDVATWTSMLSSILSGAGIANEILGFTTRAWKGGQSRELWLRDGKPERPGRLNDLRHIIYKSFEETFQEADTNFSVMLREGILKENIDGEALLWAYSRLQRRHSSRKILLVLSDGAPVDDSTLSVNDGGFLERHLISSISWIKSLGSIELYGIGIGFSVARYYGDASPSLDEAAIGPDILYAVAMILQRDIVGLENFQRAVAGTARQSRRPSRSTKRGKGEVSSDPPSKWYSRCNYCVPLVSV